MLIAHWPLEGNPNDEAFGNYNGTEIGGVSYGSGILGDCYDNTSGSGTGIQLMEHADAQKFDNVFSWSLWFKSTTTSGSNNERILARDDSEYPTFTIDQNQSGQQNLDSDAAGSAQVNEWHHAAFVHQSDQTVITYIDGVRQGTRSAPKAGTARPWVIGGNTEGDGDISGGHFEGKIDDVRFYDHVLSKAEVKELAQGKVGHWDFFDGNAYDSTIQRNHGTINGDPQKVDGKIGSDALLFDGSDDSVNFSQNDFDNLTEAITCSLWARRTGGSGTQTIFLLGRDVTAGVEFRDDSMTIHTNSSEYDTNFSRINQDQWVHLAVSYKSGNGGTFYKDGNQIGSIPDGGDIIYPEFYGTSPSIGSHGGIYHFKGDIDDVRIYSTALSGQEIQTIYETKARLDEGHRFHGHAVEEGAYESFETGSFSENWNVSNATISSSRQYRGTYSFGSWGDGGIEATWEVFPGGERKIKSFEYFWKEDSSQSGHVVALNDSNGNVIQESGTENPQWYLNNGSGGREFISSSGTNYNVWTKFRFEFDWENGNYNYLLEKTNGSYKETGTQPLESASNGVQYIRFSGGSSLNNYGSGNYNRFDGIKVNEEGVREEGFIDSSKFSEVGPAADSLVGWWDFDRENARDKAGSNDGSLNGSIAFGKGVTKGKAVSFDGLNSGDYISLGGPSINQSYSISVWVYPTALNVDSNNNYRRIVALQNNDNILLLEQGGSISFRPSGSEGNFTAGNVNTNTWSHITVTWDGSSRTIYKDGERLSSDSVSTSVSISSYYVSTTQGSHQYAGRIDDLRFYNRDLTDEEVDVLYEMSGPDAKMKKRPEGFYAPQFSETQL